MLWQHLLHLLWTWKLNYCNFITGLKFLTFNFEIEIFLFHKNMQVEVTNTIKLFSKFWGLLMHDKFITWQLSRWIHASTFCTLWKTLWDVGMQSSWHMNIMSRLSFLFWWCALIGWTLLQMYLQLTNWCYKVISWKKYAWCGDLNWGIFSSTSH